MIFSETWDPVLSSVILILNAVVFVVVAVMYIVLTNLDKAVKIYNGLFNLNEDKGAPRSDIFTFFLENIPVSF